MRAGTPSRRCILGLALAGLVGLALASDVARAQPLTDGDHRIDLVDLPILGAPRAVGVGGAYGALGEGVTALPWNPAAAAARGHWEHDWLEWEIALGALFPTRIDASRFFGGRDEGSLPTEDFAFFDVGLRLQFGPAAFGVLVRQRRFDAEVSGIGDVTIGAQTAHADVAWAFRDGDLVVGLGVHALLLSITNPSDDELLDIGGASGEAGVTYRPTGRPYRVATVLRGPIDARDVSVDPALDAARAVPRSVNTPWELAFSGAFGFGERPLNATVHHGPRPRERRRLARLEEAARAAAAETETRAEAEAQAAVDATTDADGAAIDAAAVEAEDDEPPTERGDDLARYRPRYGVVTAELVLQGRTRDGISLDGFLEEQRRGAGSRVTVSPRVGIEGEPWRNRMKLRAGTYLEAARSDLVAPRMHFTHGFDLRLFDTDLFGLLDEPLGIQVTYLGDVAREYTSFGVGVGIFH